MSMQDTRHRLVSIRHGQSQWNLENRFTGWADVSLTEQGRAEAQQAGEALKAGAYAFDMVYTSKLMRAQDTMRIALKAMGLTESTMPEIVEDWRLNERHYGGLTGLNKDETREKYGDEQVHIWRRSYDVPPPEPSESLTKYPGFEPEHYAGVDIPTTESLKDTLERFLPCWQEVIAPAVQSGKRVLIVAHGNSLRALIKHLSQLDNDAILKVEIPTGKPFVYELDIELKPVKPYYFLDVPAACAVS